MNTLLIRLYLTASSRLRGEAGQTSAEYALVLFGAASVALLLITWAQNTGKIGELLDVVFDKTTKMAD